MVTPDTLIIGAGIIGCSFAHQLAKAGQKVTVLDGRRAGGGASSAAAGLLTPMLAASPAAEALAELPYQSAAMYESWIEELRQDGASDVGFRRQGLLEVATDPVQAARLQAVVPSLNRPERRVEWLTADELRKREPALIATVAGAVLYPDDAQVDPAILTQQVARVAERGGVVIREGEAGREIMRAGDRISAVHTDAITYHPGTLVMAAGAWSSGLVESLGIALPTRPVKGQMLQAHCRLSPVRMPMFVGDALFVPRPDGSLVLGVTVEEAGFDERGTIAGIHTILRQASAAVPVIGQLEFSHAWAGLRPATPDGCPYMGPVPPIRNLWVSTGHFRKGILLAPICARLVARSILAGRMDEGLEAFEAMRLIQVCCPASALTR